MIRNIIYFSGSIILFFAGVILYGIILNIREDTLQEAMAEKGISELSDVSLVVDKSTYRVELYSDSILVKSYKAVFGKNQGNFKRSKDEKVTPVGRFKICNIDTNYLYHKKLMLNFPNSQIAAEALKYGFINKQDHDKIAAVNGNNCPPFNTKLGGEIGIIGIGEYDLIFRNLPFAFNWTDGSIAISNESIDELHLIVKIGTPVEIRN